jgi:hypothetical protein
MGFDLTGQGERLRNQWGPRFLVWWRRRRNHAEPRVIPAGHWSFVAGQALDHIAHKVVNLLSQVVGASRSFPRPT